MCCAYQRWCAQLQSFRPSAHFSYAPAPALAAQTVLPEASPPHPSSVTLVSVGLFLSHYFSLPSYATAVQHFCMQSPVMSCGGLLEPGSPGLTSKKALQPCCQQLGVCTQHAREALFVRCIIVPRISNFCSDKNS